MGACTRQAALKSLHVLVVKADPMLLSESIVSWGRSRGITVERMCSWSATASWC
jgi:hypothetical protein